MRRILNRDAARFLIVNDKVKLIFRKTQPFDYKRSKLYITYIFLPMAVHARILTLSLH